MATVKELREEARAKINEETHGSYVRGFDDGANTVIGIIEDIISKPLLGNPFATLDQRFRAIIYKIEELKGIE